MDASIVKDKNGYYSVVVYKDIKCPSCNKLLFKGSGIKLVDKMMAWNVEIVCRRCKALLRYQVKSP